MKNKEEKVITCEWGRARVSGEREGGIGPGMALGLGRREGAGCLTMCYFCCGFLLHSTPTSSSLSLEYS